MNRSKLAFIALLIGTVITSCESVDDGIDSDPTVNPPIGAFENTIMISNEGGFMQGNASLTVISNDLATVDHNVFNSINERILGDTAQSMAFTDSAVYIVVNGSNTIEVLDRLTFESIATIDSGLSNPRFMTISNGKGYVTNWGDFFNTQDDYVAVIDLSTNSISTSIPVDYLPEEIISNDTSVYVATGVFDNGNSINVINSATDELSSSISVGDNPDSMQFDDLGNLWVLCQGKSSFSSTGETAGKIMKINTSNNTVSSTLDFELTQHPKYLQTEKNILYYNLGDGVYKFESTNTSLPSAPAISGLNLYDMSVNEGKLYGLDAGDFVSPGALTVYDLNTNTEIESLTVGINPGEVYFN